MPGKSLVQVNWVFFCEDSITSSERPDYLMLGLTPPKSDLEQVLSTATLLVKKINRKNI